VHGTRGASAQQWLWAGAPAAASGGACAPQQSPSEAGGAWGGAWASLCVPRLQIRRSFRTLATKLHPDRAGGGPAELARFRCVCKLCVRACVWACACACVRVHACVRACKAYSHCKARAGASRPPTRCCQTRRRSRCTTRLGAWSGGRTRSSGVHLLEVGARMRVRVSVCVCVLCNRGHCRYLWQPLAAHPTGQVALCAATHPLFILTDALPRTRLQASSRTRRLATPSLTGPRSMPWSHSRRLRPPTRTPQALRWAVKGGGWRGAGSEELLQSARIGSARIGLDSVLVTQKVSVRPGASYPPPPTHLYPQAWLRSRGEEGSQLFTSETVADQFGECRWGKFCPRYRGGRGRIHNILCAPYLSSNAAGTCLVTEGVAQKAASLPISLTLAPAPSDPTSPHHLRASPARTRRCEQGQLHAGAAAACWCLHGGHQQPWRPRQRHAAHVGAPGARAGVGLRAGGVEVRPASEITCHDGVDGECAAGRDGVDGVDGAAHCGSPAQCHSACGCQAASEQVACCGWGLAHSQTPVPPPPHRYAPISPGDLYSARVGGIYGSDTSTLPYVGGHDGVGVVKRVGLRGIERDWEGTAVLPIVPDPSLPPRAAVPPPGGLHCRLHCKLYRV